MILLDTDIMIVLLLSCIAVFTLSLSVTLIFISSSDIRKKTRRKFFIYFAMYSLTMFGFYIQQPYLYSLYIFNKYSKETIALLIITSYIFEEFATAFPFGLFMEFGPKISYIFFQLFAILSCLLRLIGGPINNLCANALISFSKCSAEKILSEYRSTFHKNDPSIEFTFSNNLRLAKVILFLITAGLSQLVFSNSSSNLNYIYIISIIGLLPSGICAAFYKPKEYEPKSEHTTKSIYLLVGYLFHSLIKIMIFPRIRFFIDDPKMNNIALLHLLIFCSATVGDVIGYYFICCTRPHIVLCFSSMILAGLLYTLSYLVEIPYIVVGFLAVIVCMFHISDSFFRYYVNISIYHRVIVVIITSITFSILCNAKPQVIANISSLFAVMMNICSIIFTLDLPK